MKNDQLNKIFDVIGTPSEDEDLSFIHQANAIKYIKNFHKRDKCNFQEKYPGTPDEALHLLNKMLEFNPSKRISAEEALKDHYFNDVRIKS